jgi:hypothetical protein
VAATRRAATSAGLCGLIHRERAASGSILLVPTTKANWIRPACLTSRAFIDERSQTLLDVPAWHSTLDALATIDRIFGVMGCAARAPVPRKAGCFH